MENAPVLRNGNTYIPYSYINYLLKNDRWNIGYVSYDKDGNIFALTSYPIYDETFSYNTDGNTFVENTTKEINNNLQTELLSWSSEPEIFADPYSDFLTENIAQSLSDYSFSNAYAYEYILHKYNRDNDEVTFQYKIKSNENDKIYVLSMIFENRNNNWIKYDSYIADPAEAAIVE